MTKKLTALPELEVAEISTVKRGANQKSRFPITKEEGMDQEILKAVLETEAENEKELDELLAVAKASDKGASAAKSALRILQAFKDEMPEGVMNALQKVAGIGPKEKAKKETDEEEEVMETKVKKGEVVTMSDGTQVPAVEDKSEKILKAQADQIAVLTKQLEEQKDQRELDTWIAKAEKDLANFPGMSFEEMGKQLKSLSDIGPEVAQKQFDSMKAASDALKESEIFKEAGKKNTNDPGDAWTQIVKLADGLVEKSDDVNFTQAQAMAKVLETERGSKLYSDYLDQNPAQCGR
jgi:phage-related protein